MRPLAQRLWVLWGEPTEGRRFRIGELWKDTQGYAFAYVDDLGEARAEGFRMLPEFPTFRDARSPFRSAYLFPTFAQRLPSPRRADFESIMATWGVVNADNPLEMLAASGGVQMTDRIELAEHRRDDDDLTVPLFARVAGARYYQEAADKVVANSRLLLVREPSNAKDECAVMLCTTDGQQIGYVPKQYSRLVARAIDAGQAVDALAIRWQTVPGDRPRLVVRLSKPSATPQS